MSREGTWTCETCPNANNMVFPKTNDGNNRLNCFLCDWNICTDCVGAEVTLTAPEKEDWQNFFENTADENQDGFLSVDEVHAAFPEHDKEWAQRLVDAIDSDHDGRVSLEEFRAYYHSELDDDTYHKNLTINRRKRLLRKQDSVDGWNKKSNWTETNGQWQQTNYWINTHTGERTDEDPFKHNSTLEMKNKAALKRMESTDGAKGGVTQPSAWRGLPHSTQPSAASGLPYAPQPPSSPALPYSPQPSASYGPPSLPPPSYSWATSAAVASPPQASASWTPPPPLPPPTAPPMPPSSSAQAGWIDPPPISMYKFN